MRHREIEEEAIAIGPEFELPKELASYWRSKSKTLLINLKFSNFNVKLDTIKNGYEKTFVDPVQNFEKHIASTVKKQKFSRKILRYRSKLILKWVRMVRFRNDKIDKKNKTYFPKKLIEWFWSKRN